MTRGLTALLAVLLLGAFIPPTAHGAPATEITWLSTGDSYSSGEGVRGNVGACAQSSSAWGPGAAARLADDWHIGQVVFSACTGHLVQDFYNGRPVDGGETQSLWQWALDQPGAPASGRFDVITMSFGGNDIGFADVIMDCLGMPFHEYDSMSEQIWAAQHPILTLAEVAANTAGADLVPFLGDDCDVTEAALMRRIDSLLHPNDCGPEGWRDGRTQYLNFDCTLIIDHAAGITGSISDFWAYVADRSLSDDGVIVVQGYPALFATSSEWGLGQFLRCNGVTRGDANMLGRVAAHFDDVLRASVNEANSRLGRTAILYSSVLGLYADGSHSLCGNGDDWVNGAITITRDQPLFIPVVSTTTTTPTVTIILRIRFRHLGAFHPTASAHAAEADQVASLLRAHGRPGSGTPLPPTDAETALHNMVIPSICGHPGGRLVNGELPIPPNSDGSDPGFLTMYAGHGTGQLDDDADPEYATIVGCSHGGVSWPEIVLLHDSDFSVRTVIDTGEVWAPWLVWRDGVGIESWDGRTLQIAAELEFSAVEPTVTSYITATGFDCVVAGDLDTGEPFPVVAGAGCAVGGTGSAGPSLDSAAALEFFRQYLLAAGARDYAAAWAMLSARYQAKYGSLSAFGTFWDGIDVVGINSSAVLSSSNDRVTVQFNLWFKLADGTSHSEIVDVDVIEAADGLRIDDYRFVRMA